MNWLHLVDFFHYFLHPSNLILFENFFRYAFILKLFSLLFWLVQENLRFFSSFHDSKIFSELMSSVYAYLCHLVHNTNPVTGVENVNRLRGEKLSDLKQRVPLQITNHFGGARSLCRAHFLRFFSFI